MELFGDDLNLRPSRYSANAEKQNFRKLGKRKGFAVVVIVWILYSVGSLQCALCRHARNKKLWQLTSSGSTIFWSMKITQLQTLIKHILFDLIHVNYNGWNSVKLLYEYIYLANFSKINLYRMLSGLWQLRWCSKLRCPSNRSSKGLSSREQMCIS